MIRKTHLLFALMVVLALVFAACTAPAPATAPAADQGQAAETASGQEAAAGEAAAAEFTPNNVECIAPANPGGGWDFTCRSVSQVMTDIGVVDGAIKVTNMPGGGGAVAFANVVTQRNDDDNLLVAASPATTLRLAQGQYGDFTEDDVRWLGAVGADMAVIAVKADSPYETLDDLIAALKEDPQSVNFGGGSSIGGQDHMKVLLLAKAAGIDPLSLQYTPFDGGGEALTALLGGFVDVFPGDASEVIGHLDAGDIRVLATLAPERMSAPFDEIPTAKELGYDTQWVVFRGFYAPGGMSDAAYSFWTDALATVAESPEWAEVRQQGGLDEYFLAGPEFEEFIKGQIADFRQLSKDLGLLQ